jgi:hypothetical protein
VAAVFQTESEQRFASYLDSRSLDWEYEVPSGTRRPDFTVRWREGTFVCEVHEPNFRLANRSGSVDPYIALRRSIRKKRSQGRGAQTRGLPYVLVLSDEKSSIVFDEDNVPGAMFGDRTLVVPIVLGDEHTAEPPEPRLVAGRRSQLQPNTNTRFSAVCVVREFNPTPAPAEGRIEPWTGPGFPPADVVIDRIRVRSAALGRAAAEGLYDPEARAVRLLVFHSPYAAVPMPPEIFAGPHDQIYGLVDDQGGYGLAAEGIRSLEVPGR